MKKMMKEQYAEMYNIVGAAMEVYNTLGRGMEEAVYQEAMQIEMALRDISFEREVWFDAFYKDCKMKKRYRADLVVNDVIVELKSVCCLTSDHRAQLFNYMRLTKQKRGILMNFGGRSFAAERYWYREETDDFVLLKKDNYEEYVE
ncbi:MAG: GxxExxY protein [Bacteroidales bacterium]|nr:GxxExxY protein [Bacteroidales bacterium]